MGIIVVIDAIPLQFLSLSFLKMSLGSGRDGFNDIIRTGKRKSWSGMGDCGGIEWFLKVLLFNVNEIN